VARLKLEWHRAFQSPLIIKTMMALNVPNSCQRLSLNTPELGCQWRLITTFRRAIA